jgi:hypothetical protein
VGGAGELVVYLPNGGGRAAADIVRGSAIVGQPDAGSDQANLAAGRMIQRHPTTAMRAVPREVLMAVGTFDLHTRQIILTGPHSAGAVAEWLGMVQLDPAQLRPSREVTGIDSPGPGIAGLLYTLMERGGIRAEGHEWVTSDGRRTSAVGEALLWALESIAQEKG